VIVSINKSNNELSTLIRRTTMTKLIISTLAAAIALSSVSAFAAPKQKVQEQKVQEPIYFMHATGEN